MTRLFHTRIRKGVTTTAVAVAAMAALTASQAPGLAAQRATPAKRTPPGGPTISGDTPYRTDLPPLVTPDKPDTSANVPSLGPAVTGQGILPAAVLAAYRRAEAALAKSDPGCHLPWELLAAIGQVESAQARGGQVDANGTTHAPILGPRLDGNGFAAVSDTDGGAYDGDHTYDHAVGPMQFIPSTWATWGADGNGDGTADPNNVYDAALAAGRYLCAGGRDLAIPADLDRAILGYNHSESYLRTVKAWLAYFRGGHFAMPAGLESGSADRTTDSTRRHQRPHRPKPHRPHLPAPRPTSGATASPQPSSTAEPQPTEQSGGTGIDVPDVDKQLPEVHVSVPADSQDQLDATTTSSRTRTETTTDTTTDTTTGSGTALP